MEQPTCPEADSPSQDATFAVLNPSSNLKESNCHKNGLKASYEIKFLQSFLVEFAVPFTMWIKIGFIDILHLG